MKPKFKFIFILVFAGVLAVGFLILHQVSAQGATIRISPNPNTVAVLPGGTQNFSAYYNEVQVTDCSVSWSLADTSIATVRVNRSCTTDPWSGTETCTCGSATVTGIKAGSTTISVTYGGITAASTIVVRNSFQPTLRIYDPISAPYTNVFILNYDYPFGYRNFDARYDPDGVDPRPEEVAYKCDVLSWSSADPSIATVQVNRSCTSDPWSGTETCTCDSAKVTGRGVGSTKISVTYQGLTAEIAITVGHANSPTLRTDPASFSVLDANRMTKDLIAYYDPDGVSPQPEVKVTDCSISWSSADPTIATVRVNQTGGCTTDPWSGTAETCNYTCASATVSGGKAGSTTIRVTYKGITFEAPVVVRSCCLAYPQCNTADLEWVSYTQDDLGWGTTPSVTSFRVDGYIIYLGEDPNLQQNTRVQSVSPGREKFYPGIPVGYQTFHWTGLKNTSTTYYWKVVTTFSGTYQFSGGNPTSFSGTSETPGKPFTTVCGTTFRVEPTQATIVVGQTQQFKAFYDPDGGGPQAEQNVTNVSAWSTQLSSIATINNTGLATGNAQGSTSVQAIYSGLTATATLNVNSLPTLSAALIANPNEGTAPLNDVDLVASVSGTATGTILYTFWCNCSDTGSIVAQVEAVCGSPDHKSPATNDNPYTALDICDYPTTGIYTPKVIVERGLAASAEARTNITVTPPGGPTPTPIPTGGPTPTPTSGPTPTPGPNNPPQATSLRMSPASCGPSCHDCLDPLHPILSWTFSDPNVGDTQSKYQIEFDTQKNFSSPESEKIIIERESSSQTVAVMNGSLQYNKTYYWRMKVWDSRNPSLESSWTYYGQDQDPINYKTYTTPKHQYPTADFDKSPQTPKKGEPVQFTDKSQAFGGAVINTWKWQFTNATPSESSDKDPLVVFNSIGQRKPVKLTVWDDSEDRYWCDIQKNINVSGILPRWREIIPW